MYCLTNCIATVDKWMAEKVAAMSLEMAERLIEYSGPHSRWRLRSARRQGQGADGDPVGISLTLDQDFDAWVVDPKLPAPANVLSADRDGEFAAS